MQRDGGPGGAGGAGNPTGGSFTGLSESLDYIGDHVLGAGSTISDASQTFDTLLDFTTPISSYIVGEITCFGPVVPADPSSGEAANFEISMNDSIIAYINIDTGQEDQPSLETVPIVIPSGSKITIRANAQASGRTMYAWVTGRVHRG